MFSLAAVKLVFLLTVSPNILQILIEIHVATGELATSFLWSENMSRDAARACETHRRWLLAADI